ncbi:group 1 truncated hemoglobin [bacterium]|nr:group 1 truncated hemoglobin [bacterium]
MLKRIFILILALFAAGTALAEKTDADAQVYDLEQMCEGNSGDRSKRQASKSLYQRLGKDKKIHTLTSEIVRLHSVNPAIKHLIDERYADHLAMRVAEFIISGTGGPAVYEGPSLTHSHDHMNLSNADFMAAGSDVIKAMTNLGYGQNEIDEMVCILVSLRDQVVLGG